MSWRDLMELSPWREALVQWLVRHAAYRAPPSLSQRLEEEWLADLTARAGRLSRLRFGLGCCWAATVISHEHCGTSAAATAGSANGLKTLTSPAGDDPPFSSRRTVALLLIISVHAVLIYALASALGPKAIEVIPHPMTGELLPTPRPPNTPPLPPEPKFRLSREIEAPVPEFPPATPPDTGGIEGVPARPPLPPAPPGAVNRVLGGPGQGFPNTAEYYPAAARRMAETGTAAVRVCVDSRGRLTTHPTIAQSSGSTGLDEGALRLAQAGSGHYRATTEDGRPVESCFVFRVRFELRD